jgi:cyclophilin family peptidyl-prolyl cis-trans isomerase
MVLFRTDSHRIIRQNLKKKGMGKSMNLNKFTKSILIVTLAIILLFSFSCTQKKKSEKKEITKEKQESKEVKKGENVEASGNEVGVIETKKGIIKFKFYSKDAPNTVANFVKLTKSGFYDGTKFHRVVPGFVIQGGDPLSKTDDPNVGTGGPGYTIKAEFNSQKHLDGTVAMARSADPDSAGSQFYIALAPQPSLDNSYTVFGQVIEGMDVVKSIEQGDEMIKVTVAEDR